MKRMTIIATLLAATLTQGCAVLYATDKTHTDGTTEREFGLLGGCIPLWSYQKVNVDDDITGSGVNVKVTRSVSEKETARKKTK